MRLQDKRWDNSGGILANGSRDGAFSKAWSREWIFFAFVVVVWCFEPLARRLLDWRNGAFNPIQITSVTPFLMTMLFALVCFRRERVSRITSTYKVFGVLWVGTFTLGFLLAISRGNLLAGAYEFVQYVTPMLVGFWLAGQDIDREAMLRRVAVIMLPLGGIVAAYGLIQFVQPPPWDVLWVLGSEFQSSVGDPGPFTMRIFATLASPWPAADFFAFTILLALPFFRIRAVWLWPLVVMLTAALLLSLVREAWIGLIVGGVTYVVISPRRSRTLPFITLFGVVLVSLISSLPALLGATSQSEVISARVATLGDVNHDNSAIDRQGEILDALRQSEENPLGTGLGTFGAASKLTSNPNGALGNVLDSGYMARLLELGWLGFAGYLSVLVGSFAAMVRASLRAPRGRRDTVGARVASATAAAMAAALLWSDVAGDVHLGLDGFLFWIALGIGMRTLPAVSEAAGPVARGSLSKRPRAMPV